MSKQTAMMQLKKSIQNAIEWSDGELNEYQSGYKQALINIQNIADVLLEDEKEQIVKAHGIQRDYSNGSQRDPDIITGEEYYNKTYGGEQ